MPSDQARSGADYIRELEDAALVLWSELPVYETKVLAREVPRLMEFMAHLHHSIEHEQAMVRVNVWSEPPLQIDGSTEAME